MLNRSEGGKYGVISAGCILQCQHGVQPEIGSGANEAGVNVGLLAGQNGLSLIIAGRGALAYQHTVSGVGRSQMQGKHEVHGIAGGVIGGDGTAIIPADFFHREQNRIVQPIFETVIEQHVIFNEASDSIKDLLRSFTGNCIAFNDAHLLHCGRVVIKLIVEESVREAIDVFDEDVVVIAVDVFLHIEKQVFLAVHVGGCLRQRIKMPHELLAQIGMARHAEFLEKPGRGATLVGNKAGVNFVKMAVYQTGVEDGQTAVFGAGNFSFKLYAVKGVLDVFFQDIIVPSV